jgi:hypothetical protein
VFPGRPCGSVSSAVRSKPSMSGTDARKACASRSIAHNPTSSTKPHKRRARTSRQASMCLDLARNNADSYAPRCLRLIDTFIGDAGSHRCSMTAAAPRLQGTTSHGQAACPCARHSQQGRARRAALRPSVGFAWGGVEEDVTFDRK